MSIPQVRGDLSFLETAKGLVDYPPEHEQWHVNNSPLRDYFSLVKLDGYPAGALELIEKQIGRSSDNVGIDLAGGTDGVALRGLISEGLVRRGIVTNYGEGDRSEEAKKNTLIDFVDGDLMKRDTWTRIIERQKQLSPGGVAVILHSPVSGLQYLPRDFYKGAVNQLLNMVRPGGVLFAQIPTILRHQGSKSMMEICKTIQERSDVEDIVVSTPSPMQRGNASLIIKR